MSIGFWTMERIDTLRTKWAEGQPASVIGALLGCSRSAALGKIHRMGLEGRTRLRRHMTPRAYVQRAPRKPAEARKPSLAKTAALALRTLPAPVYPADHGVGILDVTGCKWPVREDASVIGRHVFCDGEKAKGSCYCTYHAAVNVQVAA